jgi:hypothetical protein
METIRQIIPKLVTIILLAIVGYVLRGLGLVTEPSDAVRALALLVLLFLLVLLARPVFRPILRKLVIWGAGAELKQDGSDQQVQKFRDVLVRLVEAPDGSRLSEASGLTGWYPSFDECGSRLKSLLARATSVRLLTYMGVSDIGKGTVFYKAIAENPHLSDPDASVTVRVLMCSKHSPYVSPEFAPRIGHKEEKAKQWKLRIEGTEKEIENLKESHDVKIERRSHNLPFVWRLWFVDDRLFATAMLYSTGSGNREVPVYEIHRSADQQQKRLFEMFERYFDREWDRASELK